MADENTQTQAPAKPPRDEKNGIVRPAADTLIGKVWKTAEDLSAALNRPATRAEVRDAIGDSVNPATTATQYARWTKYHGVANIIKEHRSKEAAERKAAANADKDKAKAEREAAKQAKAAEAEAKAKEAEAKAAAKAAADKEKAEKKAAADAEREQKKAAAEAEKKAKAEAKEKEKAEKAAAKAAEKQAKEAAKQQASQPAAA